MRKPSETRAAFLFPEESTRMNRHELIAIVKQSNSTTLLARRMREALHLPQPPARGLVSDKGAKQRKYRGYKKCMKQKHGVRL